MFEKLLIANRGEIACRIITSARRLGIPTVAVFSDADSGAKHVAMADEALRIGRPPVAESYLRADAIVDAAWRTGADAIHPGYGFLSENPAFVDALDAAGLTFVGPPAAAIRAMGLKDAAKALMERAGVPVVPGYHGERQEPEVLAEEAQRIGFPVLIKARAGGGGKGMRLVESADGFLDALAGARREADASFGDPACLIERYVTSPRHVEVQVFADTHGHAVHLFERDCSLQRRHQKVIEEAPAPGMTDEVRAAMGETAVEAAKAIGYVGAGTVEFIADGSAGLRSDGFWFMEMNTRLQVEHPVTEAITGLDLVELQLRVAAGEPLPFAQDDLAIDGHAFEARLYAEDVPKGFLPSTGRIAHLAFPPSSEFARGEVRVDSGVREGDLISPYYDPMIAKLIVHGSDRATVLRRLSTALEQSRIVGPTTNLTFLSALSRHQEFAAGEVDTGLIARDFDQLLAPTTPPPVVLAMAALVTSGLLEPHRGSDVWDRCTGWRLWSVGASYVSLMHDGNLMDCAVRTLDGGAFDITIDQAVHKLAVTSDGDQARRVRFDGLEQRVHAVRAGRDLTMILSGQNFVFSVPDPLAEDAQSDAGGDVITAPMPGLVKLVRAKTGDAVAAGDALIVLEAMKMEHTLTAPRDGVVECVSCTEGTQVDDGQTLLRLAAERADG